MLGNLWNEESVSVCQLEMMEKVRMMKHTAQVSLLEEWYEADREEKKREEKWKKDG